jgi:sugar phosphate isomerase/epimerase
VVDSVRVAVPRGSAGGGLSEAATIDRTLENARKGMLLARELGVRTVALHVGDLTKLAGAGGGSGMPEGSVVSALRELAQQADASGLTLALSAEGAEVFARVLKGVDFDRAKVNLDGARLIGAGEDALKVAEGFHGEIGQFTADDAIRAGSKVRATLLGEGQLPLDALMEMLREQGFNGPLVVDVRDLPDGIAGAQHAAAVLARILRRTTRG